MSKKYFVKFLPMEEEIKKGDQIKDSLRGTTKRVNPFLCSRDYPIEGDILRANDGSGVFEITRFRKGLIIGKGTYSNGKLVDAAITYSQLENYSKVVGEISSEATFVKENDTFNEEEIKRDILIKNTFDNDYTHLHPKGYEKINLTDECDEIIREYPVKIKCPCCGTFK